MLNEQTKNQRLMDFIEFLKKERIVFNNADFAKIIGKQPSYISECLSGKRDISELFIRTISVQFPMLDKEWLLTGEGEMLRPVQNIQGDNNTAVLGNSNRVNASATLDKALDEIAEQRKLVATSQEICKQSQEQINRLIGLLENTTKNNSL